MCGRTTIWAYRVLVRVHRTQYHCPESSSLAVTVTLVAAHHTGMQYIKVWAACLLITLIT